MPAYFLEHHQIAKRAFTILMNELLITIKKRRYAC